MANNSLNFLHSAREDDFVEYFIFPTSVCKDLKEEETILKSYSNQIQKIVDQLSKDYLWHRDGFKVLLRTTDCNLLLDKVEENLPPHLYGISHYGDNIEDEWFIVFLLFQITKEIDGLIVRVADADGEFLLIEAANYLSKWANPDACEKRVYIYQGLLHIIAPNSSVTVKDMIGDVLRKSTNTVASADIQNSILNRIKGYPQKIKDNLHSTAVYVPAGVAAVLKQKPSLIAHAIQAFCNRDSVDLKACRAMKYFPPENRVYFHATFTKCLYAMLTHSKYIPDKRTGWNLPSTNSPQYKSHNLGVKVACGFEILISQAKPSADVENDKGWHSYLKSLKDKDYFRNFMEHSRDYNNLLNKAKEYYINYRDSMQVAPVIGQEIMDLIKNFDYNVDDFKNAEANLPKDDDDSWLNINSEELDKMLEEKYGHKNFMTVNGNTDAANFTEKLTEFLNHVSEIDGAEFPNSSGSIENNAEDSPVRPPRGIKRKGNNKISFSTDTKLEEKPNSNKVNFDPNAFTCTLQNILDIMIPDDDGWDLDSDSDMSAYGEEPDVSVEGGKELKNKMEEYMKEMDKELAATTIGQSFQIEKRKGDGFDDVESFQPVDIDMNALKNVLESYQAQMGEAGPVSNMLGPMGIHLETGINEEQIKNGETK